MVMAEEIVEEEGQGGKWTEGWKWYREIGWGGAPEKAKRDFSVRRLRSE